MLRPRPNLWLTAFTMAVMLCASACSQEMSLNSIKLPAGFAIDVYASNVPNARSMTFSPSGTLYVGTRSEGKVYAILDHDHDNRADEVITIAGGLNMPNGVAYRDSALYVAEVSR
ncbi:MAG TPA: sorbosone dehydrogenase family protein, partial [Bacteroidota bacterium]